MYTGEYDCNIIIILWRMRKQTQVRSPSPVRGQELLQAGRTFPQGVRSTSRDFSHLGRREGRGFGETLGSQAQCLDGMRRHCIGLNGVVDWGAKHDSVFFTGCSVEK
jgi:hypothetical protein